MVDRIDTGPGVAGSRCRTGGHGYGGPGGWRACACGREMFGHRDTPPDPAGGPGCGMVWRVCAGCAHVEEHHVTDHDPTHADPTHADPTGDDPTGDDLALGLPVEPRRVTRRAGVAA